MDSVRKMQAVRFESVTEFLYFLPEDELQITEQLRDLVLEAVPGITEKLSFNVPFYSRHRGLFFIWPSSVLWGKKKTWNGVRFGFQGGHLLTDEHGFLDRGSRKQVAYHDFISPDDIRVEELKPFIDEAVAVDDAFASAKRKR